MADQPRALPKEPWPGHLRNRGRPRHDSPKLSGGAVAQQCTGSASKNRGHPSRLDGECLVPHGICTLMKSMEVPAGQSPLNRSPPNAQLIELPPADDAMLPVSKVSDPAIDPTRRMLAVHRSRLSTKSAFGTHTVLNALLVTHAANGLARDRTRGTCFAPKASPERAKRGSNPPLPPLALIPSSEGGCLLPTPRGQKTPGSRAVCVGSNGETALVRVRASAPPYHRPATAGRQILLLSPRPTQGWIDAARLRSSGRRALAGRCRRDRSGRAASRR
jgi:hypothetical protein